MGRKIGNALIIYGIINFIVCLFLGPFIALGGFIWMIILILLGKWQRDKAKLQEELRAIELEGKRRQDTYVNITNQIANQPEHDKFNSSDDDDDALADRINKILDAREGKPKGGGIRYIQKD